MAFQHQPLSEQELGPGVLKVVGEEAPEPMKVMAARGLAPLGPRDLVVVLYHFWVNNTPKLSDEAAKTAIGLPSGVLGGALGDPSLPPGVLDFLGRKLAANEEALEQVVRHPNVHDETLTGVARVCPEGICDVLAENQTRWLQHPPIVESLYSNPKCRMSVIHRVLELAIRQGIDLKLPNLEEIKATLGAGVPVDESRDDVFKSASGGQISENHDRLVGRVQRASADETVDYDLLRDEISGDADLDFEALLESVPDDTMSLPMEGEDDDAESDDEPSNKPNRVTQLAKMRPLEKIRLAIVGDAFERSVLIRDTNKAVALSVVKSPRVKENEVIAYTSNRTLSVDVIREIAKRRDWTKLYQIKYNLVLNPKTPLSSAMSFLGHLHAHDVRKVARSRNIPSALAQAAKRKAAQRR